MKTILIADRSHLTRWKIRTLVEHFSGQCNIIEATSRAEVLSTLSTQTVDYAILDLSLSDGNIFMRLQDLARYFQHTRALIFSAMREQIYGKRLIANGAKGYLSKQAGAKELHDAIDTLLNDHTYVSSALMEDFFKRNDDRVNVIDSLSDRELQIVACFVMGMSDVQIAQELNVSNSSAYMYQRRIFRKMDVKNTDELAFRFLQWGATTNIPDDPL